jgi:hypothetical protein
MLPQLTLMKLIFAGRVDSRLNGDARNNTGESRARIGSQSELVNSRGIVADRFTQMVSESALTWRRAVAPYAERAAYISWANAKSALDHLSPATRLTQSYRKIAKGKAPLPSGPVVPRIAQTM